MWTSHPLGRSHLLGGPSTFVDLIKFSSSRGSVHFVDLSPIGGVSPFRGSVHSWTLGFFHPLRGSSTLGLRNFFTLEWVRPFCGVDSFSPSSGSDHFVD